MLNFTISLYNGIKIAYLQIFEGTIHEFTKPA